MMYTDDDDDDDWDEFFLMDLCMKFCASLALFFQYLPAKLKFSPISNLGLRLLSLWPQGGGISLTTSIRLNQINFCPLHQHCNNILTVAGFWLDCQLQTNLFCWETTAVNNKVADLCFLVWSVSRLCCGCSGSIVTLT
jgi:hypothetical protein